MKYLVKCLLIISLLLVLGILSISVFIGYQNSINFIIDKINIKDNSEQIFSIITLNRFRILQCVFALIIIVNGLIIYYFAPIYNVLAIYVRDFFYTIKQAIKTAIKSEVKYFLIIPIVSSIYFAITQPVSYDEAWTYLNFTSKSVISSAAYYPAPNNHVLHSIITNFTIHCPFFSSLFSMRISSILVNLFIWLFTYSFITKYFNKNTALILVSITSMLFMCIYYSYMSRGYGLVNLFFIVALFSAFNIIKEKSKTRDWVWFALSSILGFHTMPSFLYPFITLNLLILIFNYKNILKQLVFNSAVSISVLVLYLPIIILNGIESLTNNRFVTPIPRKEIFQKLPAFFLDSITEITGISWMYFLPFLILSLIILVIKKKKEQILIYLLFILSPFLLLAIHSVIPFSRTFVYYGFILVFLICIPWSDYFQKIKLQYIIIPLLLIQAGLLLNFHSNINEYENYSVVSHNIINKISGNKKYLCNSALFDALLLFELKTNKFNNSEMQYYGSVKMSADSLSNYDFIIIDKSVDQSKKRKAKYATSYYNVY